ncbi:MAG: C40 family peptidase [Cyclobacteriaceae bacterium]|nr:C40 family peptidase [Cyclobacteriaceae bacterium]
MEILGYGVCRLSLVSVRQAPQEYAPLVTQLLFGDHYEVLDVPDTKNWIYIRIHFDGSEGWIDAEQHHGITFEYFEQINNANFKITTDLTCGLLFKKSPVTILIGSIVPISNSELFKLEEQFAFNGESKSLGQKREAEFVKSVALKYLNAPYLAGGKNPFGVDAAGFIQMVFKISGTILPRTLDRQILEGKKVDSLEESHPGDVAFLKGHGKNNLHAGIILDDQKIIHADGKVRIDHLHEEGILRPDTKIYTHSLIEIRRFLAPL